MLHNIIIGVTPQGGSHEGHLRVLPIIKYFLSSFGGLSTVIASGHNLEEVPWESRSYRVYCLGRQIRLGLCKNKIDNSERVMVF